MSMTVADDLRTTTPFGAWIAALARGPQSRDGVALTRRAKLQLHPHGVAAPCTTAGACGGVTRAERCALCETAHRDGGPAAMARLREIQPEPCEIERRLEAEQNRARRIEDVATHYVSPCVLERLMADPNGLHLGGEAREVTILFADVRGFTSLAAVLRDQPGRLVAVINSILNPLTEIVLAHGGTIDKYMGDCVMAFWGAPDADPKHAANALRAAQAMLAAMPAINADLAATFPELGLPEIEIGIGVNTGECVVGNVGSHQRFDYSVLGDAVNVASRLQALCKTYEFPLLLGVETARQAGRAFDTIEIDDVAISGHEERQPIYAII